ncbi:hypothetical protein D9M69_662900 [compost metagenome]
MPTSTMAVMKPLSSSILPTDSCISLMSGGASAAWAHPPAMTAAAPNNVFQLLLIVVSSNQQGTAAGRPRPISRRPVSPGFAAGVQRAGCLLCAGFSAAAQVRAAGNGVWRPFSMMRNSDPSPRECQLRIA